MYLRWEEKLETPSNFRVNNENTIIWDNVANADKYEVVCSYDSGTPQIIHNAAVDKIDGATTSLALGANLNSQLLTSNTLISVKIRALNNNNANIASDVATFTFTYVPEKTYDQTGVETIVANLHERYPAFDRIRDVSTDPWTYVFFTGTTIKFTANTIALVGTSDIVSVVGNVLTIKGTTGTFQFTIDGQTRNAMVVDFISLYEVENIEDFDRNKANSDIFINTAANATAVYKVGADNDFKPNLNILNRAYNKLASVEMVYTLYPGTVTSANAGSATKVQIGSETGQFQVDAGGKFNFSKLTNGIYTLASNPRFVQKGVAIATEYLTFDLVDGVNVYDNWQLQTHFADMNVTGIVLHNDIAAKLRAEQINPDGTPYNYYSTAVFKSGTNEVNTEYGAVYLRASKTVANNTLDIHGNYFTVSAQGYTDGKKNVPFAVPGNDGRHMPKTSYSSDEYPMMNMQIGIFYTQFPDISGTNKVNYNNLQIVGNVENMVGVMQGTPDEIHNIQKMVSLNSGAMHGIWTGANTHTLLNNSALSRTHSAMHAPSPDTSFVKTSYAYVNNNWANSMYVWGGMVQVENSYFGTSGGPSIQIDDARVGDGDIDPVVIIDKNTKIENWVTGSESWFVAFGFSQTAAMLKTSLSAAIAQTGNGIVKMKEGKEMFNLILLAKEASDNGDAFGAKTQYDLRLGVDTGYVFDPIAHRHDVHDNSGARIHRAANYLTASGDPRLQMAGTFLVNPVGHYSNMPEFGALVMKFLYELVYWNTYYAQLLLGADDATAQYTATAYAQGAVANPTDGAVAAAYGQAQQLAAAYMFGVPWAIVGSSITDPQQNAVVGNIYNNTVPAGMGDSEIGGFAKINGKKLLEIYTFMQMPGILNSNIVFIAEFGTAAEGFVIANP